MSDFIINNSVIKITIAEDSFDAATAQAFRAELDNIDFADINDAIIDMNAVNFIDSSGIGALLSVIKRLANAPGKITLTGVSPTVLSVIELLKLESVFKIESSR